MKLQHLRFFIAVVDHGGVVKAADRLRMSQPALSSALKMLEQELGQPLFERAGGRRLIPTARAREFYKSARDILARCEEAQRVFRRKEIKRPRLRIGVLSTIASRRVEGLVATLSSNDAMHRLQMWEGNQSRLSEWMRQGRLDIAWSTVAENDECARVLWREPFVALIAATHPWHRDNRSRISVTDLDGEALILRGSCEMPRGRLWPDSVKPKIVARIERDDLALGLVASGLGLVIAPKSIATNDVVVRPLHDLRATRSIGLTWRADIQHETLSAVLSAARTDPA